MIDFQTDSGLAEAADQVMREAVAIVRAELWVRFTHDWARAGGRLVPWAYLRAEADAAGIEQRHLTAALQNLHARPVRVGDAEVVELPRVCAATGCQCRWNQW